MARHPAGRDGLPGLAPVEGEFFVIRIVLVAEMGLLRGALRAVLSSERDLEVVADLAGSADLAAVVGPVCPDVTLIDLQVGGVDIFPVLAGLHTVCPVSSVLALTTERSPETLQQALRVGVRGFVAKDVAPAELIRAVRRVAAGERVIDPFTAVAVLSPSSGPLSSRELEVLRAAAEGLSSRDIAGRLYLAAGTVRNHLSAILRKTGARNRLEAIRLGQREGWL